MRASARSRGQGFFGGGILFGLFLVGGICLLCLFSWPGRAWALDSDLDGIPDDWEDSYNACASSSFDDAGADLDWDGWTNWDEYVGGTHPCVNEQISCAAYANVKIGNDVRITYAPGSSYCPSLAWSGSEYGVSWTDNRLGSDEIYFARISAAGTKIGSDARITNSLFGSSAVKMVWAGTEYALGWIKPDLEYPQIYFTRISAEGSKIGNDMPIVNYFMYRGDPSLAWTGTEYGMAWQDTRLGRWDMFFTRISADGNKIIGDQRITFTNHFLATAYSLAWTGTEYGLIWADDRDVSDYFKLYFTRISASGNKIGGDILLNSSIFAYATSLVWTGTEYGLSWTDTRHGGREIYFARMSATGAIIGTDIRISHEVNDSLYPSLVWTGTNYGLTWEDYRNLNYEIYFAQISADGAIIATDTRITSAAGDSEGPVLVWADLGYGVGWCDNRDGNYEIYFARLSCDTDADGLPNQWELAFACLQANTVDNLADPDADGLNNAGEFTLGLEPCDPDADGDGMPDGWEVANGIDPLIINAQTDADGDGLANIHEYYNGSNPQFNEPKGRPGAGHFGDSDGSGSIGGPDLDAVAAILMGIPIDYSFVFPSDQVVQDLDGSGSIGGPDYDILASILMGTQGDYVPGTPDTLAQILPVGTPSVAVGQTVAIQVELTQGALARPGFGVVFEITGGSAVLLGGEGGPVVGYNAGSRYDLTGLDGRARMTLLVQGAGPITVKVQLPYDPDVHTMQVTLTPEITITAVP